MFEIAIVNASLSRDEFRVLAHLRDLFEIDDDEHEKIEAELREIVREKFEDPNVIDKMLELLETQLIWSATYSMSFERNRLMVLRNEFTTRSTTGRNIAKKSSSLSARR